MTTSSNFPSRFHADFPLPGVKLTQFQARVWGWLRSRAHLPQGICQASETLSRIFGCSRRYVERTLKFFQDLGVLRRVVDYGLRTRRRLFVVAPSGESPLPAPTEASLAPPPETNFLGALECAQPAHWSAPTDGLPPDPPIEVSGDTRTGSCCGEDLSTVASPTPAAGEGQQPDPGSLSGEPVKTEEATAPSIPTSERKATPEQIEATVAEAEALFGPGTWVRRFVVNKARELVRVGEETRRRGLGALRAGIAKGRAKVATGGKVVPGYVVKAADGMLAEGGPPPELAAPELAAVLAEIEREATILAFANYQPE